MSLTIVNGRCEPPPVAAEVEGFDLEAVAAVLEERGAPGVGEVEAVEPGSFGTVLSRPRRVDPAIRVAWEQRLAEVDRRVPRPYSALAAANTPADSGGRYGQTVPGGGNGERGELMGLGDHVDGAEDGLRRELPAVAGE